MRSKILLLTLACGVWTGAADTRNPGELARVNGPSIDNLRRLPGVSPHEELARMFQIISGTWFANGYGQAKRVEFRARVNGDLPVSSVTKKGNTDETVDFDIDVEGVAAPNDRYRLEIEGDLGQVTMVKNAKRKLTSSEAFRAFSDTPLRTRSTNANLTSYRSYLLRYLGKMRNSILESGGYRSVYAGTGKYEGREVHVIRVYKPRAKVRKKGGRQPMALRKMWTFWQEGAYELWIDKGSKLPRVMFYTNIDDNVYANLLFEYNRNLMPKRVTINNNSLRSEGSGDLVFTYDEQNMLSGLSLQFDGDNGTSVRLDATLAFGTESPNDLFRILPPFGFRKLNRDHLKLMLLTRISGGLLELKKHGVNLKNFKF